MSTVPPALQAPSVVQILDRALAWHEHLRASIAKFSSAFDAREVSPRLAAPWAHFVEGMTDHMKVEEQVVFPAIRALALGQDPGSRDFEAPLHEMQFELDEIATIADALRSAAQEAMDLEDDLLELLDELDVHAQKEQDVLFPVASQLVVAWKSGAATPHPDPAPQSSARPADEVPPNFPGEQPGLLFRVLRRFRALVP